MRCGQYYECENFKLRHLQSQNISKIHFSRTRYQNFDLITINFQKNYDLCSSIRFACGQLFILLRFLLLNFEIPTAWRFLQISIPGIRKFLFFRDFHPRDFRNFVSVKFFKSVNFRLMFTIYFNINRQFTQKILVVSSDSRIFRYYFLNPDSEHFEQHNI